MEKEKFSLKDHLFNEKKVRQLANELAAVHTPFKVNPFVAEVVTAFPQLELKQRITHIAHCLKKYLVPNYKEAAQIILKALPAPLNPQLSDDDFGDFIYAPYSEYISLFGCDKTNYALSMKALYELTKRFSVEFSIRNFINAFPDECKVYFLKWSQDKNYQVRRLCSEATRPTLPWACKISYTSADTLPILQNLYIDKTRYVTRSVANHLNDISKKEPELLIKLLNQWRKEKRQEQQELDFIIKHSLRTLIKKGHPKALALVGIGDSSGVNIQLKTYNKVVALNSSLSFEFSVASKQTKDLLIDYIVYFKSKNGAYTSKVFKLKNFTAEAREQYSLVKKHKFLADASTRTLHKGLHKVAIQVNGSVLAQFEFDLV
jgi:3-methyladenine DNA glycosylase AlkC